MDAAAVPSNLTDIAAINGTLQALLATIMVNMITVNYPPSAEVPDKAEYDVIIVGAGSAGSALARRLADSGCFNVLLVEAGGDPEIQPPGLFILFTGGAQDWDYHAENNGWACQAQNNAQIGHTRGKMLGGCSCLDHLIFIRGSSKIFDDWEKMGNEGWNWENCFEYFKRIEDIKDPKILNSDTLKYHGQSGPMVLTPTTNKNFSEKEDSMLKCFENLGTDFMPDTNIPDPMGRGRYIYQIADKEPIRSCVANTYLANVRNKGNLDVLKNTLVSKLIIKHKTVIGVELIRECGTKIKAYARKEVVLSAGAFNTPQILLLSGIGPKPELEKLGIPVVLDSPKVGKNLQDHVHVPVAVVGGPSQATTLENAVSMLDWKTFPLPMVGSLFNVNKDPKKQSPEIQTITLNFGAASPFFYYLCHITFNFNHTVCKSFFNDTLAKEVYYTLTILNNPLSRGEVTLRSTDIKDPPVINAGFFRNKADLITLSKGVKKVYELLTECYEKVGGSFSRPPLPQCDDLEFGCDDYWLCYTRIMSSTTYHPAGTCAMGPDGVTDSDLKVRGIKNLRVVDASVIPKLPTANIEPTVIMIAEYAADKIKKEYACEDETAADC